MTTEQLLTELERRTAVSPVVICPNCHLPLLNGQLTDSIESQHLACPTKNEERRDYYFTEDGE
ncbi:MAG: hypothetical protein WA651_13420 [Candidatus Sulfotelmatobacter sp.]